MENDGLCFHFHFSMKNNTIKFKIYKTENFKVLCFDTFVSIPNTHYKTPNSNE